MAKITGEDSNGVSYDFGVSITRGTVASLAATATGVVALTGAIYGLISNITDLDDVLNKSMIKFGGYANTIKALTFAQDKIAKGVTGFDPSDIMQGMSNLQSAGLNAKEYFDLVNQAAEAAGSTFSDMAATIRGGDFGALAEMGIITDRMAVSLQSANLNAQQASKYVAKMLKEAKGKGLFNDTIQSLPAILQRFKQFKRDFVFAILGDPKDPEGLANTFKRYLNKIADALEKNRNRIIYYGKMIGSFLKFIMQVVGDFLSRAVKKINSAFGVTKKSVSEMKDSLMSFQLWLAILRAKINHFVDQYGEAIYKAIKFMVMFKLAAKGLEVIGNLGGVLGILRKGFELLTSAMAKSAIAALTNPYVMLTLAIFALGYALLQIIKHWDGVRTSMQKVGDSVLSLIAIFAPFIGIPLILAKHWNSFKALFINVFRTITNVAKLAWYIVKDTFKKWVWDPISTAVSKIADKFKWLTEGIKNAFSKIVDFFRDSWLGKFIQKLVNGTKAAADSSANVLRAYEEATGRKATAKGGVTKEQLDAEERTKKLAQGKTLEDINYMQGNVDPFASNKFLGQKALKTDAFSQSMDSSAGATIDKSTKVSVNKGAIVINVNRANVDENALAAMIEDRLRKVSMEKKARQGSTETYD